MKVRAELVLRVLLAASLPFSVPSNSGEVDPYADFERRIALFESEMTGLSTGADCTKSPNRQILVVAGFSVFHGVVDDNATGRNETEIYLRLTGSPSPSSCVNNAIVKVVEDGPSIRRPKFDPSRKQLQMHLAQSQLPSILDALRSDSPVYAWVGHFPNGSVYGDIHSSYKIQ